MLWRGSNASQKSVTNILFSESTFQKKKKGRLWAQIQVQVGACYNIYSQKLKSVSNDVAFDVYIFFEKESS